ncbi:MAG: alpha amylase C-terminal domain-containing protein [Lachnospiraceae bacterium]|nr:alpha amylase C-terminal domain-containing protein [Lachnospiraceae bacterium]
MSFLISNAIFYLDKYHIDGIRVDGVSSMLYLNYGVEDKSEYRFNKYGEEGNLEAIEFLKNVNRTINARYKGVITIAEESTAWPKVTTPTEYSGLGFTYKWDMGWMHDTLDYMRTDFPYRKTVHDKLTFSMMYADSEHFILPLSHDEVVHGKCSIIRKMPGYYEDKFKGCRNLYLYQLTHSGGKLNFMGNEFCQFDEWKYYVGLDFFLVDEYEMHRKYQHYVKTINGLYLDEKALWDNDYNIWQGFKWIDANDKDQNIFLYERISRDGKDKAYIVINFSTDAYEDFILGVDDEGAYKEIINTNEIDFGGDGKNINDKKMMSKKKSSHGKDYSIEINVPALSAMIIKYKG